MRPTRGRFPAVASPLASRLLALVACEGGSKETVQVGYRGLAQELNYDTSELRARGGERGAGAARPRRAVAAGAVPERAGAHRRERERVQSHDARDDAVGRAEAVVRLLPRHELRVGREVHEGRRAADAADDAAHEQRSAAARAGRASRATAATAASRCRRGSGTTPTRTSTCARTSTGDVRVQSHRSAHEREQQLHPPGGEHVRADDHMSRALGVNCTYCHNSRSWTTWQNAPPARVTAMYGFRMVRDLNTNYLTPLASTFPAERRGPHGDAPKLQCITCHRASTSRSPVRRWRRTIRRCGALQRGRGAVRTTPWRRAFAICGAVTRCRTTSRLGSRPRCRTPRPRRRGAPARRPVAHAESETADFRVSSRVMPASRDDGQSG